MTIRQRWLARTFGVAGLLVAIAVGWSGCTTIRSIFAPPPAPSVPVSPPAPLPPRVEPVPPAPIEKGPEAPPPPRMEPETPPAEKETPPPTKAPPPTPGAPPVKKEPAPPAPVKKEPEAPPPPKKEPETLPAKKEPEAPPPILAPQVGKEDEEQLKRTAGARIQRTEQLIGQLEGKNLSGEQQEHLMTVRSLLANAREALAARDLAKASNLAEKARLLAEDLSQSVK